MHKLTAYLLLIILCIASTGCAPRYQRYINQYKTNLADSVPNYSNLYYWAAHPDKKDPSDSVPQPLRKSYQADSSVDVFFIHPTTLTDPADTSWNASMADATINAKTDYSSILYQASVFNEFRLFAPRYRQAHVKAYFTADSLRARAAFNLAYQDIRAAFLYYLDHYNQGRPIIIASHSQGSTHAQRLLKEFFDDKPLRNKLVAAYVFGMYIPNNAFNSLRLCQDSLHTGCIIGWRTYKKNYEPDFVKKEKSTSLVVNPLTWKSQPGFADHSLNEGSILLKFNKLDKHVAGAEVKDGVLWLGRLHLPGGFLIRRKNYHIGDINLFYVNIRKDVKRRVGYFWKN